MSPGPLFLAPQVVRRLLCPLCGATSPHSHLVQFYEIDGFLIDSLSRPIAPGSGGAVSSKLVCLSK